MTIMDLCRGHQWMLKQLGKKLMGNFKMGVLAWMLRLTLAPQKGGQLDIKCLLIWCNRRNIGPFILEKEGPKSNQAYRSISLQKIWGIEE